MEHSSILVIVGPKYNEDHDNLVRDRVNEGLSLWDSRYGDCLTHGRNFVNKCVPPTNFMDRKDSQSGVVLKLEGQTDVQVLMNPSVGLVAATLQAVMVHPSANRLIIHAGPVVKTTNDWILSDGLLTAAKFIGVIGCPDVQTAMTMVNPPSITTVSCLAGGGWNETAFDALNTADGRSKFVLQRGNLDASLSTGLVDFMQYLSSAAEDTPIEPSVLMPPNKSGGVSHPHSPSLYVFSAGYADAALFMVDGFTMAIDAGFGSVPAYWPFAKHLHAIDALLVAKSNLESLPAVHNLIARSGPELTPKIGCVLMNIAPKKEVQQAHPLEVSVHDLVNKIADGCNNANIANYPLLASPAPLASTTFSGRKSGDASKPITVYDKIGHGKLEMFVLNPIQGNKQYDSLLKSWANESASLLDSAPFPLTDIHSTAVLLVWLPADPNKPTITVLFPGNCPQKRLLAALTRLDRPYLNHKGYCKAKGGEDRFLCKSALETLNRSSAVMSPSASSPASHNKSTSHTSSPHSLQDQNDSADLPSTSSASAPTASGGSVSGTPFPPMPSQSMLAISESQLELVAESSSSSVPPPTLSEEDAILQAIIEPVIDQAIRNAEIPVYAAARHGERAGEEDLNDSVLVKRESLMGELSDKLAKIRIHSDRSPNEVDSPHPVNESSAEMTMVTSPNATLQPTENLAQKQRSSPKKPAPKGPSPKTKPTTSRKMDIKEKPKKTMSARGPAPTKSTSSVAQKKSETSMIAVAGSTSRTKVAPPKAEKMTINKRNVQNTGNLAAEKPIYIDAVYVPKGGDIRYADSTFYSKIRAAYYILSSPKPSIEGLDSLIKGKEAWQGDTCLLPAHESSVLSAWIYSNQEQIYRNGITVLPAASACHVNLELGKGIDESDSSTCPAYRIQL